MKRSYPYHVPRVDGRRQHRIQRTGAAGALAATASSACFAMGLAADAAFFHARHTVAAKHFGHIKQEISTAEIGSQTR